ncbi:MAG TPA: DUF6519 domain-containing protein [Ktedonobacterales bacterium]|jgi:hypothetical protein
MKGDFTRSTFRPEKHYSSVRMQQGRVQVDADWNEELDILAHRIETEAIDVIGPCGAPKDNAAFAITLLSAQDLKTKKLPAGDFMLSKGRYYVDGILCENEADVSLTTQPDLPGAQPLKDDGLVLLYLDVWQRHLTALDDDLIREKALGGPDTATRTKTIWQVKPLLVQQPKDQLSCTTTFPEWDALFAPSTGLSARTNPTPPTDDPCIVPAQVGYRRLENQLYRVEIHQGSATGAPTFKWSRENGSVVAAWLGQSSNNLTVSSTGRDQVLGFASGQWVELTDDTRELQGLPGTLVQLVKVEGQTLTIDPTTASGQTTTLADFPLNPKVRRWDSAGALKVEIPTTNNGWIPLEDGVEVQFAVKKGTYRPGDYWLIPARTASGDVEWPQDSTTNAPAVLPPMGIQHHFCRLALLQVKGGALSLLFDCRPLFPPLTNLPVGGGAPPVDPALHITSVRLRNQEKKDIPLKNGAEYAFVELLQGIRVLCDGPIDKTTLGMLEGTPLSPTCYVTVDVPQTISLPGIRPVIALTGFQPLILAAAVTLEFPGVIFWNLEVGARTWIQETLLKLLGEARLQRVLFHLTLKGNFIWAADDPNRYLDGEALGVNENPYNLRLPSGDGRRGGTFEMWFWMRLEVPVVEGGRPLPVENPRA